MEEIKRQTKRMTLVYRLILVIWTYWSGHAL